MYVLIGLIIGAVLAFLTPVTIPAAYSEYVAIALLGALDSAFGGIDAMLRGRFRLKIFLAGFFGNAIIAWALTFVGDRLGINLFLPAAVVFGTRIFQNFEDMRRYLLTFRQKKDKIENKNTEKDSEV